MKGSPVMLTFKATLRNGKDVPIVRCSFKRMEDATIYHANAVMSFVLSVYPTGTTNIMSVYKAWKIDFFFRILSSYIVCLRLGV